MHYFQAVSFRTTTPLLLFFLAAVVGNYFNLQLFWGIQVMFGSIAVLLAIRFYGTGWGMGVALLSGLATAYLLHNPHIMMVQVVEALAVGLTFRRLSHNLVLLDGVFWLLLGMPIAFLMQYFMLDNGSGMSLIMTLRAGINGVFNALVGSLLVQAIFLMRWFGISHERGYSLTLRQVLFNLLVSSALVPALLVAVLDSRHQHSIMEAGVRDHLNALSKTVAARLAKAAEGQGATTELMQESRWHELQKADFILLDPSGVVVASTRPEIRHGSRYDPQRSGEMKTIGDSVYLWLPPADEQVAALRWKGMRYFKETPLDGVYQGKLIAEMSSGLSSA